MSETAPPSASAPAPGRPPAPARPARPGSLSPRAGAAIVVAVALALYANSLGNAFVWDDTYVVRDNPSIRSLANVPSFFTQTWGAGTTDERGAAKNVGFYRPLPLVTYAVDHALWGLEPFGFHLTNVLIHALLALLVWSLARRLTGDATVALAAGLLYAAHATHTEAVDVIAYRTSLLAVGFVLLGLRLHLRARDTGRDLHRWLWVPLVYVAGLLSKEDAIVLPGLLLAADLTGVGRPARPRRPLRASLAAAWRPLAATWAPILAVTAGYFALRANLVAPVPIHYFSGESAATVALTMTGVFGLYLRLLLVPWPLTPFYDWSLVPPARSLWAPEVLAGLLALLVYVVALAGTWRRARGACFLLLAYGIALLPYSHVLPFVVVAADRFLLLPSFAFAIGLPWGVARLAARPGASRGLWWGLVALLVAGNAALTLRRNTHWADNATILRQTAADHPDSFNARMRLGEQLEAEGDTERALAEYRAAHRIFPGLALPLQRQLGLLRALGREVEARAVESELLRRLDELRGRAP